MRSALPLLQVAVAAARSPVALPRAHPVALVEAGSQVLLAAHSDAGLQLHGTSGMIDDNMRHNLRAFHMNLLKPLTKSPYTFSLALEKSGMAGVSEVIPA